LLIFSMFDVAKIMNFLLTPKFILPFYSLIPKFILLFYSLIPKFILLFYSPTPKFECVCIVKFMEIRPFLRIVILSLG